MRSFFQHPHFSAPRFISEKSANLIKSCNQKWRKHCDSISRVENSAFDSHHENLLQTRRNSHLRGLAPISIAGSRKIQSDKIAPQHDQLGQIRKKDAPKSGACQNPGISRTRKRTLCRTFEKAAKVAGLIQGLIDDLAGIGRTRR